MQKIGTMIATAAMVLPLAVGAATPLLTSIPVAAATTKKAAAKKTNKKVVTKKYTITKSLVNKKITYHGKANKGYFYKGSPSADRPTISLKRQAAVKKGVAYQATKRLTLQLKKSKAHAFVYIKGHGWTATSNLKSTKKTAKTYQIVSGPKKVATATYHVLAAKKAYLLKTKGKKAMLKKGSSLKTGKNYQVTKVVQLKAKGAKAAKKYLAVKQGKKALVYVLATNLVKGKIKAAK